MGHSGLTQLDLSLGRTAHLSDETAHKLKVCLLQQNKGVSVSEKEKTNGVPLFCAKLETGGGASLEIRGTLI